MQEPEAVVAVAFSKDRAMQLDAALRSLQASCRDLARCRQVVIYACSHKRHERQYETLKECYSDVEFIREESFQSDLVKVLKGHTHVLFLVDDNLFVRPWRISQITGLLTDHPDAIGFSLRLGRNTTFCYTLNRIQELPAFEEIAKGILQFEWPQCEGNFGYPLEVSSSVYRVGDLLPVIESASGIKNPNLLESVLHASKESFAERLPWLLCFEQSAAFCNPINVVQSQYVTRHGGDPNLTSVAFMRRFDLGYRIDLEPFEGFVPEDCHQLVPFTFLSPKSRGGSIAASIEMTSPEAGQGRVEKAPSSGEMSRINRASCRIELDSLEELERDSILSLWQAMGEAIGAGREEPWLLHLARTIHEDRQFHLAELAERTLEMERKWDELAESERGKAWLKDELDRWMETAEEQNRTIEDVLGTLQDTQRTLQDTHQSLRQAREEIEALRASRTFKLATLFRDAQNSRKLAMLLPLRLLIFVLPARIKQFIKNIMFSLFEKCTNKRPKGATITNPAWPEDQPLVSVIILGIGCSRLAEGVIESLLAQTWQDLEIVLVCDEANGPDLIKVADNLKQPKIQILRLRKVTSAKARNAAIRKARGKYICCLDIDDRLAPTYLEKCLFHLESKGLDICGCRRQDLEDSQAVQSFGPFSLERLLHENCLNKTSVFRKDLWKAVGGYDETLAEGCEDWELWIRMARAGACVAAIQEPLVSCRVQGMPLPAEPQQGDVAERLRKRHRFLWKFPELVARIDRQRGSMEAAGEWRNLARLDRPSRDGPINILLAMPFLVVGGAEALMSQLCSSLSGRGFHFTIITTGNAGVEHGDATPLFEKTTQEIYHLPRFLDESQWQAFLLHLIKSRNIRLLWQVGSPFVYDLMPTIKTFFPQLRILDFLFNQEGHTANNRKYNYCIDSTLTENERVKEWLIAHGETRERIRCFRSGVDLSHYAPLEDKQAVRRRLGLGDDFIVGYCGRFSEEKCPEMFIEMAHRLRRVNRIGFLMTGAGPLLQRIQSRIRELKLTERIHFFGTVSDVRPYLGSCDALVLPSKLDGRPTVVMQALAMGIPVIASEVGALPEIISNNHNGFLCGIGKVDEFVQAIRLLASDSVLRAELSRHARRYAEDELDAGKGLAEIESFLMDLVRQPGKAETAHGRKGRG